MDNFLFPLMGKRAAALKSKSANFSGKKVLVTGGCGYIGSHVVRQLSSAGAHVIVIDDLSTGVPEALLSGETLVRGSFGDEALVARLIRENNIKAAIHFAAFAVLPESVTDPLKYYENNVSNTVRFLRAATAAGLEQIVFSSTGSLYGDFAPIPTPETFYPQPSNPYSRSKRMCEWIIEDVSRATSMKHVILRYFNVAGAGAEGKLGQRSKKATHLIKIAAEHATGKRPEIFITGTDFDTPDGTGIRDYIHVEDLASAHLAALEWLDGGGSSETFNAGYGHGYSVREVLAAVERATGRKLNALEAPRRPGDIASSVADTTKIRATLKWVPRHDNLDEIVRSAIDWERSLP
jgi:UDP-glucose 4-epimerase